MKVCLSGAQSCGKTTILDRLKPLYPKGLFIKEVVRSLNKPVNNEASIETQLSIYAKHCQNLMEPEKRKLVFYDRGLIDSVVYARILSSKYPDFVEVALLGDFLLKTLKGFYDLYFYFPPNIPLIDDGFRSMDSSYRQEVSSVFLDVFNEHQIPYIALEGTIEERLLKIELTLEKYNKDVILQQGDING
jgi:nicotinamide riboside kinase